MARGAPPATQIQFTARVRLATGASEPALAPGNEAAPNTTPAGPFIRYAIDFAVDPREFSFTRVNAAYEGSIRFIAYLYDTNGNLITRTGSTLKASFKPATYAEFLRQPLSYNLDLSSPEKGPYFLRLAIQDETNTHVGTLELPLDSVKVLPALQSAAKP